MLFFDSLLQYLLGLSNCWVEYLGQCTIDEVPVVETSSPLLLLCCDVPDLEPQKVSEILLAQHYVLVLLEAVLHTQLEDGPQTLYRVELGTVSGLKK